ncbi:MAG: hypothetical protein ACN0LA_00835 [Candidatus Longimicrobiales bacterium M2_2A_002]
MTRHFARPLAAALLLLGATGPLGCSDLAGSSPLADARRSPEALARAAVEAVARGDVDGLDALLVTREEYETLLWPVLPDRNQMPFEFAWSITAPRSRKARRATIAEYRGVPLELERVELGTDVERYREFTLYRRSRMWVRRPDTGAVGVLPLMDTLVEMDDGWKFMNFVDDA